MRNANLEYGNTSAASILLVKIGFVHYGSKSQADGFKEFVIANDIEEVIRYVDDTYCLGGLFPDEEDDTPSEILASDEWWNKHPGSEIRAIGLGLTVDGHYIEGKKSLLTRFWQGDSWQDPDGGAYGTIQYDWQEQRTISIPEVSTLVILGVAKDVRGYKRQDGGEG